MLYLGCLTLLKVTALVLARSSPFVTEHGSVWSHGVSLPCDGEKRVQLCPMNSSGSLAEVATEYGGEFSLLFRLLEQAGCDTVDLFKPWGHLPGGTAFSASTRDRFLQLAEDSAELAASKIKVEAYGDDWVRIYLSMLGLRVKLRARPRTAHLIEPGLWPDGGVGPNSEDGSDSEASSGRLFESGLIDPPGHVVVFWRFNLPERSMSKWSIARVVSMDDWFIDCPMYEEVDLPTDVLLLAGHRVPVEAANDHDDLADVVGLREDGEAQSEEQVTNREEKVGHDDANPASGDSI